MFFFLEFNFEVVCILIYSPGIFVVITSFLFFLLSSIYNFSVVNREKWYFFLVFIGLISSSQSLSQPSVTAIEKCLKPK